MNNTTFAIKNIQQVERGNPSYPSVVVVEGDRIIYAGMQSGFDLGKISRLVDGKDWIAAPGLIDLQINGAFGYDFTTQPESISQVALRLPETGVTAFLPTFITSPLAEYKHKLTEVLKAQKAHRGARVLGAHIEGPFLNPDKHGAHDASLFCEPAASALETLTPIESVRMVTLAPEIKYGVEAIQWLIERRVVVSIGHSAAQEEHVLRAAAAGATCATHLYNAMPALHHRDPGLAGILLTSGKVRCGIIADGVHSHPHMVKLAYLCCGHENLYLVTDAMGAMGMPPGSYQIGGQSVTVNSGVVCLADGTLAGSVLRMDEALQNMMGFTGCSLADALDMASKNQANLLGENQRLGQIKAGYKADMILLNESLEVQATFVSGKLQFASPDTLARLSSANIEMSS
jgi:N-acetylglucosamine-6-phosphate deacetylase